MVNDDNEAAKFFLNLAGRGDIGRHVFIVQFRADKAAVERIEKHDTGPLVAELRLDVRNQNIGLAGPGRAAW